MSSELDLLRQENVKLMGENASLLAKEAGLMARIMELEQTAKENAELKARVAKLEQTAEENAELKARVAKLEQKQLQNDISSNTGSSNRQIHHVRQKPFPVETIKKKFCQNLLN